MMKKEESEITLEETKENLSQHPSNEFKAFPGISASKTKDRYEEKSWKKLFLEKYNCRYLCTIIGNSRKIS